MEIKIKTDTDKCIICGSNNTKTVDSDFAPFLEERMFNGEKINTEFICCNNCGIYYSGYRPSDEQMNKFYKDYRGEEYQKQRQGFEPEYSKEFNSFLGHDDLEIEIRKQDILKMVKRYTSAENIKTILDYGGDKGQFIPDEFSHSDKYVYEISNVEPVSGVKVISDKSELASYKWDLIMCNHVLEHVSYPIEILNELKAILPTDSYLYIELPCEDYIEECIKNNIKSPIHEHINLFKLKTLENMFSDHDFVILENKILKRKNSIGQSKAIGCLVKKSKNPMEVLFLKHAASLMERQKGAIDELNVRFDEFEEKLARVNNTLNTMASKPTFLQQIFSIRNEGRHKVLRVLGIKIKFSRT